MNILVRNLDRSVSEDKIMELFRPFGTISYVTIVHDQRTGQSKGFGFVDMPNQSEAEAAIKALNLTKLLKESIRVKAAIPKTGAGSISEHIKLRTNADQAAKPADAPATFKPAYKSRFKKPYNTYGKYDTRPGFPVRREGRPSSSAGKPYSSAGPEYRYRGEHSFSEPGKTGFALRHERGTGYQGAKGRSFRSTQPLDRNASRFPYRDGGRPSSSAGNPFSRFSKKPGNNRYTAAGGSGYPASRPSSYTGKYDPGKKNSKPFSRFPKRDAATPSSTFKDKTFAKTRFHKP